MAIAAKAAITADLGGESELSEIEKILVEQAALASVVVKDAYTKWLGGEPMHTRQPRSVWEEKASQRAEDFTAS